VKERWRIKAYLAPLRKSDWVVYAKHPFGGPRAVLAYLSRYIHPCLSGFYPHPQDVGCFQAPE
jgi:hypothetical protein